MRIIVTLLVILLLQAEAQISQKEKKNLSSHVDNISLALQDLQEELQKIREKYSSDKTTHKELVQQQQQSYSLVRKGKILYYEREINKGKDKIRSKNTQLYIYYGVLQAFERYKMSQEQRNKGARLIPEFQKKEKSHQEKIEKAQNTAANSQKRIRQIDQEIPAVEKKIASLKRKLRVLNGKKTWGNLSERTSLSSQIGIQNSLLLKLKGEQKIRQKVLDDAWSEKKALSLELAEVQIALRVFK